MQLNLNPEDRNLCLQILKRIHQQCVVLLKLPAGIAYKQDWLDMHHAMSIGTSLTLTTQFEKSLLIASICYCPDFFAYLLEQGCEINDVDFNGWSAMHHACSKGYIEIVKLLVKENANLNLVTNEGQTAFMIAIKYGYPSIVKYLLGRTEYELMDRYGMKTLHFAVLSKHIEIVELILPTHKHEIDDHDHDGNTPLLLACRDGLTDIAITLLENGANPYAINRYGNNILHGIGTTGIMGVLPWLWHYFTVEEFATMVNSSNDYGWTPLHVACQRGNEGMVTYFLEFQANPSICNFEGLNAVDIVKTSAWYNNFKDCNSRKRRIVSKLKKSKLYRKKEPKTNPQPASSTRYFRALFS